MNYKKLIKISKLSYLLSKCLFWEIPNMRL